VTCLDCHTNGHTSGPFHINPDTRFLRDGVLAEREEEGHIARRVSDYTRPMVNRSRFAEANGFTCPAMTSALPWSRSRRPGGG
jgi:hypothetical protein